MISRLSKASLDMVLKSKKEDKIHFILDGIDLARVIKKKEMSENYSDRSTTAAELCFLYRHRDDIKDKVIFYQNAKQAPAPWLQEPQFWSAYKPKHRQTAR